MGKDRYEVWVAGRTVKTYPDGEHAKARWHAQKLGQIDVKPVDLYDNNVRGKPIASWVDGKRK